MKKKNLIFLSGMDNYYPIDCDKLTLTHLFVHDELKQEKPFFVC